MIWAEDAFRVVRQCLYRRQNWESALSTARMTRDIRQRQITELSSKRTQALRPRGSAFVALDRLSSSFQITQLGILGTNERNRSMLLERSVMRGLSFLLRGFIRLKVRFSHDFFGCSGCCCFAVSPKLFSLDCSPTDLLGCGPPSHSVAHVSSICSSSSSTTTFSGNRKEPSGRLLITSFMQAAFLVSEHIL